MKQLKRIYKRRLSAKETSVIFDGQVNDDFHTVIFVKKASLAEAILLDFQEHY
jgi:hypothetical protein